MRISPTPSTTGCRQACSLHAPAERWLPGLPRPHFAGKGHRPAIAIARAVGLPLRIAAKIDRVDEAYFRPRSSCCRAGVTYIGEIDDRHKSRFLGDARALLFPIAWPEPFGLAMIEAMACGTPVLAFRNGAVNEVIDEGVTGHVVDGMDDAVGALERVLALDRGRVRQRFDERFCVSRMAQDTSASTSA
jgi:glycosyltransferase involved in cell wall biosynthesis